MAGIKETRARFFEEGNKQAPPLLPLPLALQKAKKVYLLLHKECDAEWRFLKG